MGNTIGDHNFIVGDHNFIVGDKIMVTKHHGSWTLINYKNNLYFYLNDSDSYDEKFNFVCEIVEYFETIVEKRIRITEGFINE